MKSAVGAIIFILLLIFSVDIILCLDNPANLPGVYEVASNGQLNISIADIHRYEAAGQDSWFLAIGLVVENCDRSPVLLDPESFLILGSRGETFATSLDFPLRNPLKYRELGAGEVAVGSIAFKLRDEDKPIMLFNADAQLKIRLDKETRPPDHPLPAGELAKVGNCIVGLEGILASNDGRMLRVDYIMKNYGQGVMLLEPRDYGKFGVLIDSCGWSYNACDYKMLGPAVAPGETVEGFMTYTVPDGSYPKYILFWPPDEDAILFDLGVDEN